MFNKMIEQRRALLTNDPRERKLALIETEALSIAHRELANAMELVRAFFPEGEVTPTELLQYRDLLAGFYGIAVSELMERGEIERPQRPQPAGGDMVVVGGGN